MRENFLIASLFNNFGEIADLSVDFSEKNIRVDSFESFPIKENRLIPPQLRSKLSKKFFIKPRKLILALDSQDTFTIYEKVSLTRDKPREPLNEAELENIISQALWKLYDEGRRQSAIRFGVNELEILLFDTRIYDFLVDGRSILNPLGSNGKQVDVCLVETFVNRRLLNQVKSFLNYKTNLALITESSTLPRLLSRLTELPRVIFAKVLDNETLLFKAEKTPINRSVFLGHVHWGKHRILESVKQELETDFDLSEDIIDKCERSGGSEFFCRHLNEIIGKELKVLEDSFNNVAKSAKAELVYLDFPILISNAIFSKMIVSLETREAARFFGFNLSGSELDLFSLTALLEYYFLPREDLVNHLAKRRMRWLMPSDN